MNDPMKYPLVFVDSTPALLGMLERVRTATKVAIDTETEVIDQAALNRGDVGRWCVTSLAARFDSGPDELYVIDMSLVDLAGTQDQWSEIVAYAWNANFERKVFLSRGLRLSTWLDLMLCQAVLDAGSLVGYAWYASLADAARRRLSVAMEGKKTIQLSYRYGVPLTPEQIAYAGQDALVTLWLADPILHDLHESNLYETAMRECAAQPFIDTMNRVGLPFDVEGWRQYLDEVQSEADAALATLASLTGGCEETLFGPTGVPTWNLNSKGDLVNALNTYAATHVAEYLSRWGDQKAKKSSFDKNDVIDKTVLQLLGGPIAEAILKARAAEKLISTYGENMLGQLGPDRRFHSRYLQALTATGRLASRDPNAQNMSPRTKRFTKPHESSRVFVCADFSQAELRLLAQVTGDLAMREAFRQGLDLHVATATRMFGVDVAALEKTDKAQYTALRSKAKTLNFGIVYGLGPARLARQLTIAGIPTTTTEAKELLARYLEIYPQVAEWLDERDTYVKNLSENPGLVDFAATWKLFDVFTTYQAAKDQLVAQEIPVTDEALAREVLGPAADDPAARAAAIDEARWALSFSGPVVLASPTEAWSFESRTPGGRRRSFVVSHKEWCTSMMIIAATSKKPGPARVVAQWAADNGVTLEKNGKPLSRDALKKVFEKKKPSDTRLVDLVRYVLAELPDAADYLMRAAVGDCIRAKKNQYRNHPIQGGVGDAVLESFALIHAALAEVPSAVGVQSVHDSIVVECDLKDAPRVKEILHDTMYQAMSRYVYDLPAKADVDVQASLDNKADLITEEAFAEVFAELFAEV